MRAGSLDRRIELLSVSTAPDSAGQPVETITVIATVWASFVQESARETFANGSTTGETKAVFSIRYRNDVTAKNRVRYAAQDWDIGEVREIGRRQGLDLYATAVT